MSEHKPCPFCGSQQIIALTCGKNHWCRCDDCCAVSTFGTTEKEAWAAWDRRADDERRCETCESFGSSLGTPDCSELFSLIEGFGVGDASFSPPPDFYCAYWTKKEESDGSD